ncbi:MAG: AAA family ATPase [Candidatus Bathyarchaeota archaeon]|nr:AAA family ATPase [Candidatus Bathyarchaeota archaeon]
MITESKIIANPEFLSNSYLPEQLSFREKEEALLLANLKNFTNTLVTGSYGSGKTTLIRKVFSKLRNENSAVYVDCGVYQTTYSILKEIIPTSQLVFYRSNYELTKELQKFLKKGKFAVCLDNFGYIKDKGLIGRFISMGICVVLVTDSIEDFESLAQSIRSNMLSIIKLPDYSSEQGFTILKNRAEKALTKWSYTDAVLRKIAEKSVGNLAFAINALKVAALKAESEGKRTIEETDVEIENDCPTRLSADEKTIMKIMEQWKSLPASRLYEYYLQNARYPKGARSFRNYMESLNRKGFVKAIGEKRGRVYEIGGGENVQSHDKMQG